MLHPKLREDFPLLSKYIYLDSACMSLKPKQVIAAITEYYENYPACAGRSQHKLGELVEQKTDETRACAAKFWHARPEEIVFTKNATESINLVARSLGLKKDDVVLTTDKEHNSNLLPWLQTGCRHDIVPSKNGQFDMDAFLKKVKTAKVVAVCQTTNLDGTSVPLKEIIKEAHKVGALVLSDAAQSAPHQAIDVKKLDVDFMAVSGHKMLGPTGVGFLYGKKELLEKLNPFMTGGGTALDSTYTSVHYDKIPFRFEAGLQNYAGITGMKAAFDYLNRIGMDTIMRHEQRLNERLSNTLSSEKISLLGPKNPALRAGIFSFNINGMDNHTVALLLNEHNILVRSGAHCVHSWFNANKLQGSVRASLYVYNTDEDIDTFAETLKKIVKLA
ncbi:MAG: cysteine desulfurase [archaeon]